MTLAIRIVADRDRTHMIAILGVTQGLAAALGPTIGGVVTQYMGWRWIFLINVPIIVLMISSLQMNRMKDIIRWHHIIQIFHVI